MNDPQPLRGASADEAGDLRMRNGIGTEVPATETTVNDGVDSGTQQIVPASEPDVVASPVPSCDEPTSPTMTERTLLEQSDSASGSAPSIRLQITPSPDLSEAPATPTTPVSPTKSSISSPLTASSSEPMSPGMSGCSSPRSKSTPPLSGKQTPDMSGPSTPRTPLTPLTPVSPISPGASGKSPNGKSSRKYWPGKYLPTKYLRDWQRSSAPPSYTSQSPTVTEFSDRSSLAGSFDSAGSPVPSVPSPKPAKLSRRKRGKGPILPLSTPSQSSLGSINSSNRADNGRSETDSLRTGSTRANSIRSGSDHSTACSSGVSARATTRSDPFKNILELNEDEPEQVDEPQNPARVLSSRQMAIQRYSFLIAVIAINLLAIVLSFTENEGKAILTMIVLIKSRDVLTCMLSAAGLLMGAVKRFFYPRPPVAPQFILTLIPAYNESQEQILKAINALHKNGVEPHHQVMLVVLDGKPKDIKSSMTRVIRDFERPYDTFKWKRITLRIIAGFIDEVPVLVIEKKTNAGKKDSLIMTHDLFNYPRDNIPTYTKRLRRELWLDILPELTRGFTTPFTRFDMMFCTDADSKIHEGALLKLANALYWEPRAIAACGLVLVEYEAGLEYSIWNIYQQFQYCYGQYVRRRGEHMWGKVTCLPGCITMIAMRPECGPAMQKYAEPVLSSSVIAHQVQYLGTDRRQTYSLLSQDRSLQTLFIPDAVSETVAPQSFKHYLAQRRRWGSNAYFNSMFYCFGENMEPMTRLIAVLEMVRLTLVYWRFANTVQFLHRMISHAMNGSFHIVDLAPLISVGEFPLAWFIISVLMEKPLRRNAHKLALGFMINKVIAPFMSMLIFTKVALNVGSQVWGISGVTASSSSSPIGVPLTPLAEVTPVAEIELSLDCKAQARVPALEEEPELAEAHSPIQTFGSIGGETLYGGDDISSGMFPTLTEPLQARAMSIDEIAMAPAERISSISEGLLGRRRSAAGPTHLKPLDIEAAQAWTTYRPAIASNSSSSSSRPASPTPSSPGRSPLSSPMLSPQQFPARDDDVTMRNSSVASIATLVEEQPHAPAPHLRRPSAIAFEKMRNGSVVGFPTLTIAEEEPGEFREVLTKLPIVEMVGRINAQEVRQYLPKETIVDVHSVPATPMPGTPMKGGVQKRLGMPSSNLEIA